MGGLLFAQGSGIPGLWFTMSDLVAAVDLEMLSIFSLYLNATGLLNWRLHLALLIHCNTPILLCKTALLAVILSSSCEADEEGTDLASMDKKYWASIVLVRRGNSD